jgi:hypothetical protein
MRDPHAQVLEIVRAKLDGATAEIVRAALQDADRLTVIRDAFLEGRDALAVKMIRDLDPAAGVRALLPTSTGQNFVFHGGSALITARPQLPFTPLTLLVSRECARFFDINDVRIGMRSVFVQSGEVPADVFEVEAPVFNLEPNEHGFAMLNVAQGVNTMMPLRLDLGEVQPATDMVLIVTNNRGQDPEGMQFRAAWYGTVPHR